MRTGLGPKFSLEIVGDVCLYTLGRAPNLGYGRGVSSVEALLEGHRGGRLQGVVVGKPEMQSTYFM